MNIDCLVKNNILNFPSALIRENNKNVRVNSPSLPHADAVLAVKIVMSTVMAKW